MTDAVIAIDWGTTNRRAWRIGADGRAQAQATNGRGILGLTPTDYPRDIAAIREELGDLPVIAAGMVGSNRGWRDIPYVPAPADAAALARACGAIEGEDVTIVPGVALTGARCDVMRGEEVQVTGASVAGLVPRDARCCQPGTHNKWVTLADGRIVDFTTSMTGELFALLRGHGTLSGMLDGPVAPSAAFDDGVARGIDGGDLASALFEVRARVVRGRLAVADAAAFASGVLIGADVAARCDVSQPTWVIATAPLDALYAAAIAAAGGVAHVIDAEAAFLAGIGAIRKEMA